jgi:osmotically-inducible protein OsmY
MKTDSQLQSDVLNELKWRPHIHAAYLGVSARHGVVTLTGQVGHFAEKAAAESATKAVAGVKGIANEIQVVLPNAHKRTDQDIAQAILNAWSWDHEVPADGLKVTVTEGQVKLEGIVDGQYQKDAASRSARHVKGVCALLNLIDVKPKVKWSDVTAQIEAAFRRRADLESRRISVSTRDGQVTLEGDVASLAERDEAIAAAWAAPGVSEVKDDLRITP